MSHVTRRIWRYAKAAAAACLLVAIVDIPHGSAAPITPIPDGPQTIQLVTVPTVVGATFSLDGTLITTGEDGLASMPLTAARDLSRVTLVDPGSGLAGGKAEFVRLTRAPDKDGLLRAYALFKISRDVSFTFRDSIGNVLPPQRVTSLTIKSSIGESFTLSGEALTKPISLPSERSVAFVNGDSAMKEIYYSVQEVVISGSNTVFRSQQKFFPVQTSSFEVETVFYTLTVKTSDSLFGFATGSNVVIRWPDLHISKVPIRNGRAILPALPRGDYDMRIEGAGLNTWRPISVSRDQTVELQLLSYLDGFVVLAILLAIATVCIIVGRRRLGRRMHDDTEMSELEDDEPHDFESQAITEVADPEPVDIEALDLEEPVQTKPVDDDESIDGVDADDATNHDAISEPEVAPRPRKPVAKKRKTTARTNATAVKR